MHGRGYGRETGLRFHRSRHFLIESAPVAGNGHIAERGKRHTAGRNTGVVRRKRGRRLLVCTCQQRHAFVGPRLDETVRQLQGTKV